MTDEAVIGQKGPILSRPNLPHWCWQAIFILGAVIMTGCSREQNVYQEPPPPVVSVARPARKAVTHYLHFTGRTVEVASVDVRARVKGFLESIHFQEGAEVKKGDILYVIDPKPFKAALERASAELSRNRAQLMNADSVFTRKVALFKENVISEEEMTQVRSDRDAAGAAVQAAEAQVKEASLDLGYCRIHAPISGRIGKTEVDVGNLVGGSEPTLLATIKALDPMYAYFAVSERDVLEYRRANPSSTPETSSAEGRPLFLGLADEDGYPHEGKVDFVDLGLDPSTGTILVRGIFTNPATPQRPLLPGFFARIRAPVSAEVDALLVDERALGMDQGGRYLLVVNSKNIVEKRPVELGDLVDGERVIRKGISEEDRVIVSGIQRARPGMVVQPEAAVGSDADVHVSHVDSTHAEEQGR
ncbi:MAG: Efflux pump periplasmic linker BepF [bacterium]|nr:Efflux pump periplasmic linker BepF [bacterium]